MERERCGWCGSHAIFHPNPLPTTPRTTNPDRISNRSQPDKVKGSLIRIWTAHGWERLGIAYGTLGPRHAFPGPRLSSPRHSGPRPAMEDHAKPKDNHGWRHGAPWRTMVNPRSHTPWSAMESHMVGSRSSPRCMTPWRTAREHGVTQCNTG